MNKDEILSAHIYREYDIRGDAEKDLKSDIIETIGRAYAKWLKEHGVDKMTLGGDVRISTERIRAAITKGALSAGVNIVDVGTVTTPMLYWSIQDIGFKGGVMITGSHNPSNMNGMKLCWERGTLWGEQIQEIGRMATREQRAGVSNPDKTGGLTHRNIADDYLAMLKAKFAGIDLSGFKVVCDSGNGTAGPLARKFFESLGCECVGLFEEPDGTFPNHHPDPQKRENLQDLIAKVREIGADVGFAFDGDADRIGVVDEKGDVIFGDRLMALYWREILKSHPGATVIVEPKCSMALPEAAEQCGGNVLFWKSGHSVIKAKMREVGAPFAGEYSGHMFFADEYYGFDDSFYAAGRLLRIMAREKKPLSEIMNGIALYPTTEEIRVACPDSEKFALVNRIRDKAVKDYGQEHCMTADGIRIVYPGRDGEAKSIGWGLIRASNTQPVITTRCEGRDQAALEFIMNDIKNRILAEGLPDFTWTF